MSPLATDYFPFSIHLDNIIKVVDSKIVYTRNNLLYHRN